MTDQSSSGSEFSTPALVVDLDVFDSNVEAMATLLRGTAKTIRPHVKTHRTPRLAMRQLGGLARGVTCATVGEAEAMVQAGIDDVLVANEIVDAPKMERLARLARRARIAVAIDDPAPALALAAVAHRSGVTIEVLIDVDVLLHRCGIATADEALALARIVEHEPSLRLRGIMGYEGRIRASVPDRANRIAGAFRILAVVRDALRAAGHPVETVSAAGTSTLAEAIADPVITEIQAGTYCLMEPELLSMGLPFRCAATIRGTVISRHSDWIVLDVGRREVGVEYGPPIPIGLNPTSMAVADAHTIIRLAEPIPALGERIDLLPGQIRTTFNLHDRVWLSRAGRLIDCWSVAARGRSQ